MWPRAVSPLLASRGEGVNRLGRLATQEVYPSDAVAAFPSTRACWIIAASCGLATTAAATPVAARALSRVRIRTRELSSHGTSASAATIRAITADSGLASTEAP